MKNLFLTFVSALICLTELANGQSQSVDSLINIDKQKSISTEDRAGSLMPSRDVVSGVPDSLKNQPFTNDNPAPKIFLMPVSSSTVTVFGKVVYNDLRDAGHFNWRKDLDGHSGIEATDDAKDLDEGEYNYLGAWYVVADFYELDSKPWSLAHWNCHSEDYLGSTTLNSSGEYSFSFSVSDDCNADDDEVPDIGVRFRLRFCNSDVMCFSIEDEHKDTYMLWHPDACPDDPLHGSSGTHELTTMAFQVSRGDEYAKAACNYAYMVDAMQVWHIQNTIPFDPRNDGEVFVQYPSSEADDHGTAYTGSDHRIYLKSGWNYQSTVWHEYGHILNMRAWDGSTGNCGDCPGDDYSRDDDASWDAIELEYPHVAFKEGWAEFAKSAVSYWPDASSESFDDNEDSDNDNWICSADPDEYPNDNHRVTYPNDGKSYVRNVKKILCDWLDDRDDDDSNMAGYGDSFKASSLYSVWYNLSEMYNWAADKSGLTICDYIDYYLNGRKSTAAVGSSEHNDYVTLISNLAYNNGLECDLNISSSSESLSTNSNEGQDAEDKIKDKLDKLKEHYDQYGPH